MSDRVPEKCTPQEEWIVAHRVCAIKVVYRQIGNDTAETFITLTAVNGESVEWNETTFRRVATLQLRHSSCVEPINGLREKVKAWYDYVKSNQADMNEYARLYEKFGGIKP
jgi:hypothetical protein